MYSDETIQKIDNFLQCEKKIEGKISWIRKEDKQSYIGKFPLSHNGDLIVDFDFEATAIASGRPNLQGGTLKIVHDADDCKEKILVCRMHIFPGNCHTNPNIKASDVRGLYFSPYQTRFYSWEDMKILDKSTVSNSKHIARMVDGIDSLEDSIKYFLTYANIKGFIPLPEYDTQLL